MINSYHEFAPLPHVEEEQPLTMVQRNDDITGIL
ncbi:hypothetical protein Ptc2401_01608 [Prosthecochloris sp. CIB 2401]|nr:hypothetical protein Ptc2401_01608 [Prosthecochloris sp. CIB 2401]